MRIVHFKKIFPLIGFLILSGITLGLWQNQNDHRRQLLLHHTETSADQFRIRIAGMMNARIAALEMIADRWTDRHPPDFSRERFEGFARATMDHYPGMAGISWANPEGIIAWVFPEQAGRPALGVDLPRYLNEQHPGAFSTGAGSDELLVTPCVTLARGGIGFYVVVPLNQEGTLQGYLVGVFEVGQVMDVAISPAMRDEFQVSLLEADQQIFTNSTREQTDSIAADLGAVQDIKFAGKSWQLRLEPIVKESSPESAGSLLFLNFGFGLSAMLALTFYFLLQRMEMYQDTRDRALREVADRKKAEEALRKNEAQLHELLNELAEKNADLESFAYTVSHDLKTPIVTIDGFMGALKEDFGDVLPETADQYLGYMSDAVRKMELLVDDLLELSRIGRVEECPAEFPLEGPIREALATLQPQIQARGVAVRIQENLPTVHGQRKRIGQVMDNLLGNAVKYIGRENPAPFIEVGCEEQNGETVLLVRDNGIGVDPKYFEQVFKPFERLPAAMKAGEGTGMGLAIVKKIIESHGGRIWLQSELGRGTTFYFTLGNGDVAGHEIQ